MRKKMKRNYNNHNNNNNDNNNHNNNNLYYFTKTYKRFFLALKLNYKLLYPYNSLVVNSN